MSDEAERWRELNRANWDERTRVHLGPGSDYDLASLRSGSAKLHPIEDAELHSYDGGWAEMLDTKDRATWVARIFTIVYFLYFLLMPWYTARDKTKPVPERVRWA